MVPTLAIKVLGNDVKESEKQMIMYKAEMKAGKWSADQGVTCTKIIIYISTRFKVQSLIATIQLRVGGGW